MLERKFIQKLRTEMVKHAESSLRKPGSEPDKSFAYGQASGFFNGLEKALFIMEETIRETDERDQHEFD